MEPCQLRDEPVRLAEEADAVIVAGLPAWGWRVLLEDEAEVLDVVEEADVGGGERGDDAVLGVTDGGQRGPCRHSRRAAVVLCFGRLPLEA